MNRRYYYFQLWEGFFKNKIIKKISRLPSGDSIIVCYQRLIISTLNTDGWVYYEGIADSLIEELALELDVSEEIIKFTFSALFSVGLAIEDEQNSAIRILIIPEVMRIGSESESAGRMRKKRAENKAVIEEKPPDSAQCAHIVQKCAIDIDTHTDTHIDVEMIDVESSIILRYNETFGCEFKLTETNKQIIKNAIERITYEQALYIIDNEHQRLINREYGSFFPNVCWMFGKGLTECLSRIEIKKQKKLNNQFNCFMEQDYGDIAELEKKLLDN